MGGGQAGDAVSPAALELEQGSHRPEMLSLSLLSSYILIMCFDGIERQNVVFKHDWGHA